MLLLAFNSWEGLGAKVAFLFNFSSSFSFLVENFILESKNEISCWEISILISLNFISTSFSVLEVK